MGQQELTSVIDNFESQLSLLRKAIKKESVKRSTADKIVLNIYNATRGFSLKDLMSAGNCSSWIETRLQNIVKETDKALKNKKLYSDGLKIVNEYFKDVIPKLGKVEVDYELQQHLSGQSDYIDSKENSLLQQNADFSSNGNGLDSVCNYKTTVSSCDGEDEGEKKVKFISTIARAVNHLRKVCKIHLNNKRSENKQSDLDNSKEISKSLADLREEITKNGELIEGGSGNLGGLIGHSSVRISNQNAKNSISSKFKICEKDLSLWIGGKRIKYLKKYLNKNELKKFISEKEKFENKLNNFCG